MKEQGKGKALIKLLLILIATIGFCFGGYKYIGDVKLGLDLAGGVSITYEANEENPSQEDMDDTIYKLQRRAEGYSSESAVYQEGSNRINIDIPGVSDANAILEELGKPGSLQFITFTYDEEGNITGEGDVVVEGSDIDTAGVGQRQGQAGEADSYVVQVRFTDEGAKKFADATAANIGKIIGIVYDGELISYPRVDEAITGGECQITGDFTYEEADNLAQTIRLGALKLELTEVRSNVVGARLGQQAVSTSLLAGAIGFAIVVLIMVSLYRVAGIVASIALTMYTGLIIILLSAFEITLTLPGIAGIILSIGMAVDANVIIFTRIKEEIGLQHSVGEAINSGFHKALSAIIDGNVTTIIAAVVLNYLGSGTVKGFAQTLALGIILSMLTALFVTRWLLNAFYTLGADKPGMYGSKPPVEKPMHFVKRSKFCYCLSLAVIIVGFAAMVMSKVNTGDTLNYGLDFKGGTSTNVTFNEDMSLDQLSAEVAPVITEATGDASPQISKVAGTNEVLIRTMELDVDKREALNEALSENFGVDTEKITAENISGSVSNEMKMDAVKAVIFAGVLMLLYVWFRFKNIFFASSAVLALMHDVLVTLTFYAVLRWSVGSTFIACMLTIVGYSINATIVIFDRIREHLKEGTSEDVSYLVDLSVTETLSRSVFTSLTTFVMVLCLYILGVSSVREFALPLMVGIVCGAYSSVCITGPLWNLMNSIKAKKDADRLAAEKAAAREAKASGRRKKS